MAARNRRQEVRYPEEVRWPEGRRPEKGRLAEKILMGLLFLFVALVASLTAGDGVTRAADVVPPERSQTAEDFVNQLAAGDFPAAFARFDATMKAALPEEKLRATWADVTTAAGAFQKVSGSTVEKSGEFDVVHVTGVFANAALTINVVFNSGGEVSGLFFAPADTPPGDAPPIPGYVKPGSYSERELTVGTDWPLPATLTVPVGPGPFPAVVLVHGSGPHDRDETIGPNKPFRDIAWGLASRGIGVLRYEKRTQVHGARMAGNLGLTVQEETVDDAVLALRMLRTTAGVDPARLFVLGHSLGGTLLPRIAREDTALAGGIVLAGTTRPLDLVAIEQLDYIAGLETTTDDQKKQFAELVTQLRRVRSIDGAHVDSTELIMGVPVTYWLDLRDYRPAEVAGTLDIPLLVLQGGRDYQVTLADFNGWKAALGERKDVTFLAYPDLNHLFMPGEGTATPAEYSRPGHVSPKVIDGIAKWISERR